MDAEYPPLYVGCIDMDLDLPGKATSRGAHWLACAGNWKSAAGVGNNALQARSAKGIDRCMTPPKRVAALGDRGMAEEHRLAGRPLLTPCIRKPKAAVAAVQFGWRLDLCVMPNRWLYNSQPIQRCYLSYCRFSARFLTYPQFSAAGVGDEWRACLYPCE